MTATTSDPLPASRRGPRLRLADLRIGTKILALVAVAGTLSAVIGLVGQQALTDLRDLNRSVVEVTSRKTIVAGLVKYDWESYRRLILRTVVATTDAESADFAAKADAAYLTAVADLEKKYAPLIVDANDRQTLTQQVRPAMEEARVIWVDEIKPLALRTDLNATERNSLDQIISDRFGPLADKVAIGADALADAAQEDTDTASAATGTAAGTP